MKNLIYLGSFGKDIYREMTIECVKSLRNTGYIDDILVLTNNNYNFLDTISIPISISDEHYGYFRFKSDIDKYIDITQYNSLLFLDSDILVIKNINHIFDSNFNGITISTDHEYLTEDNMRNLTEEEKNNPDIIYKKSINTGTFHIPSNLILQYFSLWKSAWYNNIDNNDQPSMQSIISRNKINYTYFNDICSFPIILNEINEKSEILHFCGFDRYNVDIKIDLLECMKSINNGFNTRYDFNLIVDECKKFENKYKILKNKNNFNNFKRLVNKNRIS